MSTEFVDKFLSYARGSSCPELSEMCIGDVLDSTANKYPENEALVVCHEHKRYTYRELREQVEATARGLMSIGIQKGDRIGIWSTNNSEWVITQFATAKIGAILVNINPANRAFELEYVLRQSECCALILIERFRDSNYVDAIRQVCPEIDQAQATTLHSAKLPELRQVIFIGDHAPKAMISWNDLLISGRRISDAELCARETSLDPNDGINIQYTSGTTGFPKGAVLSHRNIVNNAKLTADSQRLTHLDRLCIPVPFYHCFGMVLSNMACVVTGATMIIPAAHFDAEATLRAVHEEGCTALHGVPTMFIAELDHPDPPARLDDASELTHRRRTVVDVAQQIGEREGVELTVGERQPLGLAADERDSRGERRGLGQSCPRDGEHRLALVEPHDLAVAATGKRERDQPGAGRDVEQALAGTRLNGGNQRAAPARVLAEAQDRTHQVIAARQTGEQRQRLMLARRGRGVRGRCHRGAQAYALAAARGGGGGR